jgi:hypothetical protein
MIFALLLARPVRRTVKRLHPVNVQLQIIEALPGQTEKYVPQYYIYKNLAFMQGLRL